MHLKKKKKCDCVFIRLIQFPGCFLCWPASSAIAGPGSRCSGSQPLARGKPASKQFRDELKQQKNITPTVRFYTRLRLIWTFFFFRLRGSLGCRSLLALEETGGEWDRRVRPTDRPTNRHGSDPAYSLSGAPAGMWMNGRFNCQAKFCLVLRYIRGGL